LKQRQRILLVPYQRSNFNKLGNRCRAASVLVGDKWYLFGGLQNSTENTNDIWCFDLKNSKWIKIIPKSKAVPPPLDSHSACHYVDEKGNQFVVIFGGFVGANFGEPWNQVIMFNLATEEWTLPYKDHIILNSGSGPNPRSGHGAIIHKHDMYIFGGTDGDVKYNDLWKYDLRTHQWTQIKAENPPAVRKLCD